MKTIKSERSELLETYTARGLLRFEIRAAHPGLNKIQVFKGEDPNVVQAKANAKMRDWDEMWAKRVAKEDRQARIADKKSLAEQRTKEATEAFETLDILLAHTLGVDDTVDWESLKDKARYSEPSPPRPKRPDPIAKPKIPKEPKRSDQEFQPSLGLLDKVMSGRRDRKLQDAEDLFKRSHAEWEGHKKRVTERYEQEVARRDRIIASVNTSHAERVKEWEKAKAAFEQQQAERNAAIDEKKRVYETGEDATSIEEYCDLVLATSVYPDCFSQTYELEYNPANKTVIVDYQLPSKDDLPTLKDVRYVQSRDELTEKHISEAQLNKLYDSVVYQIGLRTIHELFEADAISALDSVVFNGVVEYVDRATGKDASACIMSVQTTKDEFGEINLSLVEPKVCFKNLGGVGSSKLHSMTPVKPLQRVSREDSRFVEGREVVVEEGDNLAAMDWEDFEHLIRELFERRFAKDGGEVKVTQGSRDGGVDAIAFDPDPIRGGKIVIQAKRYTNTVGVDAVRDLYGTVQHEGAMLGILVTTSDYGPDAYKFAEDKPINLITGAELLYMLGEIGHRARIDLKEAKEIQAGSR